MKARGIDMKAREIDYAVLNHIKLTMNRSETAMEICASSEEGITSKNTTKDFSCQVKKLCSRDKKFCRNGCGLF